MQCKKCGAPMPEGAVFCPWCGTPADSERKTEPRPPTWHQRILVFHLRRNEGSWQPAVDGTQALAQQVFWNQLAAVWVDEVETDMTDNGWTTLGSHGPACVELDTYSTAKANALGFAWHVLVAIADASSDRYRGEPENPWRWTPKSVSLKYRRPANLPLAETWHYWIDDEKVWHLHELDPEGQWRALSNKAPWAD